MVVSSLLPQLNTAPTSRLLLTCSSHHALSVMYTSYFSFRWQRACHLLRHCESITTMSVTSLRRVQTTNSNMQTLMPLRPMYSYYFPLISTKEEELLPYRSAEVDKLRRYCWHRVLLIEAYSKGTLRLRLPDLFQNTRDGISEYFSSATDNLTPLKSKRGTRHDVNSFQPTSLRYKLILPTCNLICTILFSPSNFPLNIYSHFLFPPQVGLHYVVISPSWNSSNNVRCASYKKRQILDFVCFNHLVDKNESKQINIIKFNFQNW